MRPIFLLLSLLPVALAWPTACETDETPQPESPNVPDCTCAPPTCTAEAGDEGGLCQCKSMATLDCAYLKGKQGLNCPTPALATCPPKIRKTVPQPAIKPNPDYPCPCPAASCPGDFLASCQCKNRSLRDCFDNCGGQDPDYDLQCGFGSDDVNGDGKQDFYTVPPDELPKNFIFDSPGLPVTPETAPILEGVN